MKALCYIAILLGSLSCNVEVNCEILSSDQNVTGLHDETNSTGDKVKGNQTVFNVENVTEIFNELNSTYENVGDEIYSIQDLTDNTVSKPYSTEDLDSENHEEINKNKVSSGAKKRIKKLFSKGKEVNKISSDEERVKEIFSSKEEKINKLNEIHASDYEPQDVRDILNLTVYSTVNNYYCMAAVQNETKLILYGSKSWTFPLQDVNLTLTYPITMPDNSNRKTSTENVDYIITGFKVVLYIDRVQSRGYINNGGVLQDNISLSFISSGISSLLYQFWLYGIPRHKADIVEMNAMHFMCS